MTAPAAREEGPPLPQTEAKPAGRPHSEPHSGQPRSETETGVYCLLRRNIVELRLKPGAILSIKELCGHFHMSRSPVRDALIRLSQEGLVMLLPQRGTMISRIDFRRVEEERFLRVSVERQIMIRFLRQHTSLDITRLEESIARQNESVAGDDLRGFMDLDDDFHDIFYEAVDKSFCASTIRHVSGHYRRVRLLSCLDPSISREILSQHHEMMAAIRAGDDERVLTLFERHLGKLDEEEPVFLRKYPDLFRQGPSGEKPGDSLDTDFLLTLEGTGHPGRSSCTHSFRP